MAVPHCTPGASTLGAEEARPEREEERFTQSRSPPPQRCHCRSCPELGPVLQTANQPRLQDSPDARPEKAD